jgi:hypothetical protein
VASRETLDPRLYLWTKEWKLCGYHTITYSDGGVLVAQKEHSSLAWAEVHPSGLRSSALPRWRISLYEWGGGGLTTEVYEDLDDALDAASEFLREQESHERASADLG